jgi:hypothetical protein
MQLDLVRTEYEHDRHDDRERKRGSEMKREFMVERQGKAFVLYAGLLDEAHGQGLKGIKTQLLQVPSPDNGNVAICYAEVTTDRGVFTGIGDASPDNVARIMTPHILRMAETRAKARALRDAVNVGVAALEELSEIEEASDASETASRGREPGPRIEETASAGRRLAPVRAQQPVAPMIGHGPAANGAGSFAAPSSNGGLATPNQVRAIYSIARDQLQLEEGQVDEKSVSLYGSPPAELTKKQASDFITALQSKQL